MPRIYTYENLVGCQFGRLTVIAVAHITNGDRHWHCQCKCGGSAVVRGRSLKAGSTRSCGCLSREVFIAHSRAAAPLRRKCRIVETGQRFGKLVALEYLSVGRTRHGSWRCRCDCGNEKVVRSYSLSSGEVISCGCVWKEKIRQNLLRANTTHGMASTPEYRSWASMMQRCLNPNAVFFNKYGGAGVLPCAALRATPRALIALLGNKPTILHELDRIDNTMGYFCGKCQQCSENKWATNVRWATRKEQLRNRSNNALFKIGDEIKCASEWAERFSLTRNQFIYRYRANKYVAS